MGWGKLIALTSITQVLVQGLGFLSSILIIRLLSTQEYAYYILANTMLGTMIMLADSGISNGVLAEGGKVWQDKKKLGEVLATGFNLREKFGIASLLVTTPVLVYLLLENGASWVMTLLIIISIIPSYFAALTDSLLEVTPKLHQDIKPLQKNQAEVSFGRLALSAGLLFMFPFTFVALIGNSIPRIYGNFKLRKIAARYAGTNEMPDLEVRKLIIRAVKRTFPITLFVCFTGQISIWLLSLFGNTDSLAQIGALGRVSIIFALLTGLFATLIAPRFSRMKLIKKDLLKYFLIISAVSFLICGIVVLGIIVLSDQLLWVFGDEYTGLNYELFLVAISLGIGLMASIVSQLVISRGWFIQTYILIIINIATTSISLVLFKIDSLQGVLYLNIFTTLAHFITVFIYGIFSISRLNSINI